MHYRVTGYDSLSPSGTPEQTPDRLLLSYIRVRTYDSLDRSTSSVAYTAIYIASFYVSAAHGNFSLANQ